MQGQEVLVISLRRIKPVSCPTFVAIALGNTLA